MPVNGPFRGIHLPHGGDLRAVDVAALNDFQPGAAVALLNDVANLANPELFNWLDANQNNVEIFLRYFPTPVPPIGTPGFQNYPLILAGSAQHITAANAAADLLHQVNGIKARGLRHFRVIVGNEPEIEWDHTGGSQWWTSFWNDVNAYFIAVYDAFMADGGGIELYPPAFIQGAFVAYANANPDGTVNRLAQSPGGMRAFTGADADYGAFHVLQLLDHYNNGTPVGRMIVHSYFWPGYQAQQAIDSFLPAFILDRVHHGMPARNTEFGWISNAIGAGQCPTPQCCPADLDTTQHSCDGVRQGITAAGDYNDYVRLRAKLGGYCFWLLADPTNTTPEAVAVRSNQDGGNVRPWFAELINRYNQQ
jgi:hypothetical protein